MFGDGVGVGLGVAVGVGDGVGVAVAVGVGTGLGAGRDGRYVVVGTGCDCPSDGSALSAKSVAMRRATIIMRFTSSSSYSEIVGDGDNDEHGEPGRMPAEIRVYVGIYGISPETVTATLEVQPTFTACAGSLLRSGLVRDADNWEIKRSSIGPDLGLSTTLAPLLGELLPRWEALVARAAPTRVEVEIAVYRGGDPDESSVDLTLDRDLLEKLNKLKPAFVQISVY